ncbi:hypothetical protein TH47_20325 [Thalassospira sp. MCCC 1A02803]|nr:hypothetical protein AUQ41_13165 [Thalassospira sp. MCCC 1A02898]ONH85658.1 hypothetical protein TH47_20325 [Thalassospira sp. MCCC 1A02803]
MPPGWIYGQTDRGLYIVQIGQKEKREGDIRLGRLLGAFWRTLWAITGFSGLAVVKPCGDNRMVKIHQGLL